MGLFRSSSPSENESKPMAKKPDAVQDQVNLIGEGTVLDGTLYAEHDVRASGRLMGTLRVEGKAMIAESGSVEGEVFAVNADVAGRVEGDLHVEERLVLKGSARVEGTIETNRLVVEEGAEFVGECNTDGSVAQVEPAEAGQPHENGSRSLELEDDEAAEETTDQTPSNEASA